jgi:HAD superfamily hydrolase (TIGR01509 family)
VTDAKSKTCVIFDMDGTLVESEICSAVAIKQMLPDIPDTVPELVERYRGTQKAHCLADLTRRHGTIIADDFEAQFRILEAELSETLVTPIDGVHEMLKELDAPRCIASNAPRAKTERSLQSCGLSPYFETNQIFSAYEVGRWKPEPDLFLAAADQMGFDPDHCVVLEDSEVGIAAAQAAGMTAVLFAPDRPPTKDSSPARIDSLRKFAALVRNHAQQIA